MNQNESSPIVSHAFCSDPSDRTTISVNIKCAEEQWQYNPTAIFAVEAAVTAVLLIYRARGEHIDERTLRKRILNSIVTTELEASVWMKTSTKEKMSK